MRTTYSIYTCIVFFLFLPFSPLPLFLVRRSCKRFRRHVRGNIPWLRSFFPHFDTCQLVLRTMDRTLPGTVKKKQSYIRTIKGRGSCRERRLATAAFNISVRVRYNNGAFGATIKRSNCTYITYHVINTRSASLNIRHLIAA